MRERWTLRLQRLRERGIRRLHVITIAFPRGVSDSSIAAVSSAETKVWIGRTRPCLARGGDSALRDRHVAAVDTRAAPLAFLHADRKVWVIGLGPRGGGNREKSTEKPGDQNDSENQQ